MPRKPNEQIIVAAAIGTAVYGIFQLNAPNLADVKASAPGGAASVNTHKSVKTAIWTSAILVSGLGLLAKDPTVFVVGGSLAAFLTWRAKHANMTNPSTGQVTLPPQNGTPAPAQG